MDQKRGIMRLRHCSTIDSQNTPQKTHQRPKPERQIPMPATDMPRNHAGERKGKDTRTGIKIGGIKLRKSRAKGNKTADKPQHNCPQPVFADLLLEQDHPQNTADERG